MNDRINQILNQMAVLEEELRTAVHDQQSRMFFRINGKRVEFERSVEQAQRKLKTGFFRWLVNDRPQNLITGPLIYGMAIALLMLDARVSFYQWACFPVYGIRKVRRADYLVLHRHHLGYLNFIEKRRLHVLRIRQRANELHGRHIGKDQAVFLPHRARSQDTRHAFARPPLPG